MGCGASAAYTPKLKGVEEYMEANPTGQLGNKLDELEENTKLLVECFNDIVDSGKNIQEGTAKCEKLTDKILSNLESRINDDLFKDNKFEDIQTHMLRITGQLDKCRASPATKLLEKSLQPGKDKKDQEWKTVIAKVTAAVKQIPTRQLLVDIAKLLVESAEPVALKFGSKVANDFLQQCALLSKKVVEQTTAMLQANPVQLPQALGYKEASATLDKAAGAIAKVPDANAWEYLQPQVSVLITKRAVTACESSLASADPHIQADDGASVIAGFEILERDLPPWWKHCADSEALADLAERLKNAFEAVETKAMDAFKAAFEKKDEDDMKGIFAIGGRIDELRGNLEGLAPEETAVQKMKAIENSCGLEKLLDDLEMEIKKGQTALTAMLAAMQALATSVVSAEADTTASLAPRTAASVVEVENFLFLAAEKCDAEKLKQLQNIAQGFDDSTDKLLAVMGEAYSGEHPIVEKLALRACAAYLTKAEEEFSKEKYARPVLEAVRELGKRTPEGGLDDTMQARLQAVISKIEASTVETLQKGLDDGDQKIVTGSFTYAKAFDTAVAQTGIDCSLEDTLKKCQEDDKKAKADAAEAARAYADAEDAEGAVPDASGGVDLAGADTADVAPDMPGGGDFPAADEAGAEPGVTGGADPPAADEAVVAEVIERLDGLDAALALDTGMNPNKLLELLGEILEPRWQEVEGTSAEESLHVRLVACFGKLKERLQEAMRKAASDADGSEKKLKHLAMFARKFEVLQSGLSNASPGLGAAIACAAAGTDLAELEAELGKDKDFDAMVLLKNIRNMKLYWRLLDDGEEATDMRRRASTCRDLVHKRVSDTYDEDEKKRAGLLKYAGMFDAAVDGMRGLEPADLKAKLESKAAAG